MSLYVAEGSSLYKYSMAGALTASATNWDAPGSHTACALKANSAGVYLAFYTTHLWTGYIIKFDHDLSPIWIKEDAGWKVRIALDGNGDIYVAGPDNIIKKRASADGDLLWSSAIYSGFSNIGDHANVAYDGNGGVYCCGQQPPYETYSTDAYRNFLKKFSAATGALSWTSDDANTPSPNFSFNALASDGDGNITPLWGNDYFRKYNSGSGLVHNALQADFYGVNGEMFLFGEDNNIYLFTNKKLNKYTHGAASVWSVDTPMGEYGNVNTYGFALLANGNIACVHMADAPVRIISPSGDTVDEFNIAQGGTFVAAYEAAAPPESLFWTGNVGTLEVAI